MDFIFKGLPFFSGKTKGNKKPRTFTSDNTYVKASEDLKKSAEELKRATQKLRDSFRHRQEAMNRLVWIFNNMGDQRGRQNKLSEKASSFKKKARIGTKKGQFSVGEGELFEIYREACINFVETDKTYYFKLRNHSPFLCTMYKRYMGNLRHYDHEFRRLQDRDKYHFTEVEAFIANQVVQAVNKIGREKFVREGHQNLYSELCTKLIPRSANQ